jgi:hypothetical protein
VRTSGTITGGRWPQGNNYDEPLAGWALIRLSGSKRFGLRLREHEAGAKKHRGQGVLFIIARRRWCTIYVHDHLARYR